MKLIALSLLLVACTSMNSQSAFVAAVAPVVIAVDCPAGPFQIPNWPALAAINCNFECPIGTTSTTACMTSCCEAANTKRNAEQAEYEQDQATVNDAMDRFQDLACRGYQNCVAAGGTNCTANFYAAMAAELVALQIVADNLYANHATAISKIQDEYNECAAACCH